MTDKEDSIRVAGVAQQQASYFLMTEHVNITNLVDDDYQFFVND